MSKAPNNSLPSVLIIEAEDGNVFIVESIDSETQVEKILKTEKTQRVPRKQSKVEITSRELSPIDNKSELKEDEEEIIIEEYLDEYFEDEGATAIISFVDSNIEQSSSQQELHSKIEIKDEEFYEIPAAILDHQYMITDPSLNRNINSECSENHSDYETFNYNENRKLKLKNERKDDLKPVKHKLRQLTGKAACKYCDTIFNSKESLKMHVCAYLQCDPKNFICRICSKELIQSIKFIPPRKLQLDQQQLELLESNDETKDPVLDEFTGLIVKYTTQKKRYPRKTGRFECDLCGRVFTTLKSLTMHMDLHTNSHRFVCTTCGERYITHSGIAKHACMNKKRRRPEVDFMDKEAYVVSMDCSPLLAGFSIVLKDGRAAFLTSNNLKFDPNHACMNKKRRRPEVDFRIFDVRHCKYCGFSFPSFEENKAHTCQYQFPDDPKMFRCRFCLLDMSKNSYNKHMNRHLEPEKEWICVYCSKKLSDEVSLNLHLTTHTGDKPFRCPYDGCEQSFINKQLLTRHSRFHGVDIPVYACKICNKEVASKYHLKTHMKIHEDIFGCQLCKTEFDSKDLLKEHYQKDHLPYPCTFCDKTFVLPRYLKMHEKLHTPTTPKPHKCEFCISNKSFSKLALLLNHVYKVHAELFDEWKIQHPELFK
ncbi:CLUMA_CG014095, isoform A [Clunio marinus]|uniref:CLUMA_CG014095, isoform A n=1 Tax=Clunio marinus TaxID=568069 RepID=A0A1J1IMS2_9DIPT|nr:CLUMA_CG014095, isoform A [Clunio marinus]